MEITPTHEISTQCEAFSDNKFASLTHSLFFHHRRRRCHCSYVHRRRTKVKCLYRKINKYIQMYVLKQWHATHSSHSLQRIVHHITHTHFLFLQTRHHSALFNGTMKLCGNRTNESEKFSSSCACWWCTKLALSFHNFIFCWCYRGGTQKRNGNSTWFLWYIFFSFGSDAIYKNLKTNINCCGYKEYLSFLKDYFFR